MACQGEQPRTDFQVRCAGGFQIHVKLNRSLLAGKTYRDRRSVRPRSGGDQRAQDGCRRHDRGRDRAGDLDVVLRAGNIDTLVLCGVATSGVVLSTLRQAADLDYRLFVLSDGCLDQDAEVHRVLTEKVFVRQADVTTIDQWVGGLET